ncbi:ABC transporter ATP-binding protein [Chachezhania sediminis]|uniref:ABC transporter ATP-binding protein n=1 Tax=Chachezhania sediminis TaxID=2599291 RepID=UPI00131B76F9|nr:ABC transporter ATP-binding protein [Chachezhania sediminis]
MTAPLALELTGITRRFGPVLANDDISISLAVGEVLALLGENGAGKTTLMNILFGHYMPDRGSVRIHGQDMVLGRPRHAIAMGVGMVHQHFSLAPNLTVLENVMTGTEGLWSLISRTAKARAKLADLAERFSLKVDPDAFVGDLSVGEQQRVEILKALYNDCRILILDEPTAVLTPQEAQHLFRVLRTMAAEGLSIIFISHKLHEVMAGADRVVVLKSGRVVAERSTAATTKAELAELMVGRQVQRPARVAATPGAVVLKTHGLSLTRGGHTRLKEVDLFLREAEVLGIIGVSGNGQRELAQVLSGLAVPTSGAIDLFDAPAGTLTPARLHSLGVARIPEDRNSEGAIGSMTLWQNAVLERIGDDRFSTGGVVRAGAAKRYCQQIIDDFDVRGGTPATEARLLSGGNLQKLILGRNLAENPRILIAAQPTRGLDEGAIAEVHRRILEARAAGTAVLLISEELEETMALADRVQAIVGGRLSRPVSTEGLDAQALGLMMAGEWKGLEDAL